jgi:hypothetical protein
MTRRKYRPRTLGDRDDDAIERLAGLAAETVLGAVKCTIIGADLYLSVPSVAEDVERAIPFREIFDSALRDRGEFVAPSLMRETRRFLDELGKYIKEDADDDD